MYQPAQSDDAEHRWYAGHPEGQQTQLAHGLPHQGIASERYEPAMPRGQDHRRAEYGLPHTYPQQEIVYVKREDLEKQYRRDHHARAY